MFTTSAAFTGWAGERRKAPGKIGLYCETRAKNGFGMEKSEAFHGYCGDRRRMDESAIRISSASTISTLNDDGMTFYHWAALLADVERWELPGLVVHILVFLSLC